MSQARIELVPLLEDTDVRISMPIDTKEILSRLNKENIRHLQTTSAGLKKIYRKERVKNLLPAGAVAMGLSSIGGYIYFISKFFHLPSPKDEYYLSLQRPDFAVEYYNTFIKAVNASCGTMFPNIDLFKNLDSYRDARHCYKLAGTELSVKYEISWYERYSCDGMYPITDYCGWHDIFGYAWDCFNYAGRNGWRKGIVAKYQNITLSEIIPSLTDPALLSKTCGEIFPLTKFQFDNLGSVLRDSPILKCSKQAKMVCNAGFANFGTFNTTLLSGGYTCRDKFFSPEAFIKCHDAAYLSGWNQNRWEETHRYQGDSSWWTDIRILILAAGIIAMLIMIGTSIFTLIKGRSWLSYKRKVDQLPQSDQDSLSELWEIYKPEQPEMNLTDIGDVVGVLDEKIANIEPDKKMINAMRFSFLRGCYDSGSLIPANFPKEIVHKILYFADLFAEPPKEVNAADTETPAFTR